MVVTWHHHHHHQVEEYDDDAVVALVVVVVVVVVVVLHFEGYFKYSHLRPRDFPFQLDLDMGNHQSSMLHLEHKDW
jgi:hypothetical protein